TPPLLALRPARLRRAATSGSRATNGRRRPSGAPGRRRIHAPFDDRIAGIVLALPRHRQAAPKEDRVMAASAHGIPTTIDDMAAEPPRARAYPFTRGLDYAAIVAASERISWTVDEVFRDCTFDASRPIVPSSWVGTAALAFLDETERLVINHCRAF